MHNHKLKIISGSATLSEKDLVISNQSAVTITTFEPIQLKKYYFEVEFKSAGYKNIIFDSLTVVSSSRYVGIMGIEVDHINKNITVYQNGNFNTRVNYTQVEIPQIKFYMNENSITIFNFGASPFSYSSPQSFPPANNIDVFLLKKNNKIYSLESIDTWYETKMTANNTPSPLVASASSEFNTNYPAWKAFNGTNNGSYDYWSSAVGTTGWIQIKYAKKVHANIVELSAFKDTQLIANGMPKDFNILGSNDGTNFVRLAEFRGQTWRNTETKKYKFRNTNEYQYYRIEALSTNGYEYICIGEILFKSNINNLTEIQKTSANNFINYGAYKLEKLNSIFEDKSYILQDTVSKNEQGLWTTKLDRKPLSISFK